MLIYGDADAQGRRQPIGVAVTRKRSKPGTKPPKKEPDRKLALGGEAPLSGHGGDDPAIIDRRAGGGDRAMPQHPSASDALKLRARTSPARRTVRAKPASIHRAQRRGHPVMPTKRQAKGTVSPSTRNKRRGAEKKTTPNVIPKTTQPKSRRKPSARATRTAHAYSLDDRVSSKLDDVITAIDEGSFSGYERDLRVEVIQSVPLATGPDRHASRREVSCTATEGRADDARPRRLNLFAKVHLYANSRLPSNLPPARLYLPAWPLVCLAAQYSERAYEKPRAEEHTMHIRPGRRIGTKATVIKSIPLDHMNVVVLAIRGSHSFMDWAVNLRAAPVSPDGFLDDAGNFCHAGFLAVARRMVQPVADSLRRLLQERPERRACSLVMTGHSAGGAVCSLLFCHMLANEVASELTALAEAFKRIHCITFGAPPVSGLPLVKPPAAQRRKSVFVSFVNEGDPVTRADTPYVRSLLDLYIAPSPKRPPSETNASASNKSPGPWSYFKPQRSQSATALGPGAQPAREAAVWKVPSCTYSNAGKIVVLRSEPSTTAAHISAIAATDAALREVVFGDPLMHMMKVYRSRVDVLAARAITGGAWEASS